mgnify:CR=1 FL=1
MSLKKILFSLKKNQALLHYNVSSFEQIKAGIEAVKYTKIPLIFGVSEGEREYLNAGLVRKILDFYKEKENLNDLVFLNADHCKNLKSAMEVVDLNYDAVLFDGSDFTLEDNIGNVKELINYRNLNKNEVLIEGEVDKIEGKSEIQKEVIVNKHNLTTVESAVKFIKETGVDLLAISIGNVHGITEKEPELDIERAKEISEVINVPLVLHGASGLSVDKIKKCIEVGFKIVHFNTEFRKIWKENLLKNLEKETVTPYKILPSVVEALKIKIIEYQAKFFNF